MIPRERSTFSAIVDRPPFKLPDGARIVVWTDRQSRILVDLAADGAPGVAGADRAGAAARRAELVVARIRHAGRGVALFRAVPSASEFARRCRSTRASARNTRAWRRRHGRRLGIHGPRLGADADPQGRRPGGDDRPSRSRCSSASPAPSPVGWLGPGLTANLRDARIAGRRRDQIHRRLGL